MIDDVTIAGLAPDCIGVGEVPLGFSIEPPIPGKPTRLGRAVAKGTLYVTYTPENRVVTIRISVPRWLRSLDVNNSDLPVNFPLIPVAKPKDLFLDRMAQKVFQAFGYEATTEESKEAWPLHWWGVIKISYAADLEVTDPLVVLEGCRGLTRKHSSTNTQYGSPCQTIRWASKAQSLQLYSKGHELQKQARENPADQSFLMARAKQAEKVVRFESTFQRVVAIRTLWNFVPNLPDRYLPCLNLMLHPDVSSFVLAKEADRLGLLREHNNTPPSVSQRVRFVVAKLVEAKKRLDEGAFSVGRRRSLTQGHMQKLLLAYFALSGLKLSEVQSHFGWSEATTRELQKELRDLGLPPDVSATGGVGGASQELLRALDPHLLASYPPDPDELAVWGAKLTRFFVNAPWPATSREESENAEECDAPYTRWAESSEERHEIAKYQDVLQKIG